MIILFLVIGIFLVIVGGLVWYYKLLEITPGFSEENIKDRNGMAKWVGISYILMGFSFVFSSIIAKVYKISELNMVVIFTSILCFFIVVIYIGYKKYSND